MEQDQTTMGSETGEAAVGSGRLHNIEQKAAELGQRATEGVNELRSRAAVYGEGATEFLDSMSVYIKENPQRSAMIAAGVGIGAGIILGMLMRNRG